ncbi:MAG: hypothetical protein ACK4UN_12940, partial [Limisphaerales bacterium]
MRKNNLWFYLSFALSLAFFTGQVICSSPPGQMSCWGALVIADLPPGTQITSISAENAHGLALTSSGAVRGWGNNYDGSAAVP